MSDDELPTWLTEITAAWQNPNNGVPDPGRLLGLWAKGRVLPNMDVLLRAGEVVGIDLECLGRCAVELDGGKCQLSPKRMYDLGFGSHAYAWFFNCCYSTGELGALSTLEKWLPRFSVWGIRE